MNRVEEKKQKIEYGSYIVGCIGFMLLGYLIGNNGIAYMAVIMESISLFVLLANGYCADLIGRMMRSRRRKNQYLDAAQLHKAILIMQMTAAVVWMIVYFLLTDILAVKVLQLPFLANAMKLLTPLILLKAWQCVILGYFQGIGSNMPTVICSIFRQLLFLLFSLLFVKRFTVYGEKVSVLLNNPDYAGMYGAFGLCLAMVLAEVLISLFLLIVYIGSDRNREKQKSDDGFRKTDSLTGRLRVILFAFIPETAKIILKKLPFAVAVVLYLRKAADLSAASHSYGIFFGHFVCIAAVPVLFLCIRMLRVLSQLTASVRRKDNRGVRECIYAGLHYCWAAGLYFAVCMAVLAPSISNVINAEAGEVLQQYYSYGAAMVLMVVLIIFIWRVLWILGAKKIAYLMLATFNVVFLACDVFLSGRSENGILAICQATLIAGSLQLVAGFIYMVRKYVLQPDIIYGILLPLIGAVGMGLAILFVQRGLSPHVSSFVCLLLCTAIGWIVYVAILLLTGCVKESKVACVYGSLGQRFFRIFIR